MPETITVPCPKCGTELDLYMAQLGDPQSCKACKHRFQPSQAIPKPPAKPTTTDQLADVAKRAAVSYKRERAAARTRRTAENKESERYDGQWSSNMARQRCPGSTGDLLGVVLMGLFVIVTAIVVGAIVATSETLHGAVATVGVGVIIGVGLPVIGCAFLICSSARNLNHTLKYWRHGPPGNRSGD